MDTKKKTSRQDFADTITRQGYALMILIILVTIFVVTAGLRVVETIIDRTSPGSYRNPYADVATNFK